MVITGLSHVRKCVHDYMLQISHIVFWKGELTRENKSIYSNGSRCNSNVFNLLCEVEKILLVFLIRIKMSLLRNLAIINISLPTVGTRILGYAQAVYDYSATSTSQVTLKNGDRIAILSKNGQDKGWWKGENLRTQKVSS